MSFGPGEVQSMSFGPKGFLTQCQTRGPKHELWTKGIFDSMSNPRSKA
jgi:hypothetical protein